MLVDAFHAARTTPRDLAPDQLQSVLKHTWVGFHRAVAGMAASGNNIVMDHVLSERWRLLDRIMWGAWRFWNPPEKAPDLAFSVFCGRLDLLRAKGWIPCGPERGDGRA